MAARGSGRRPGGRCGRRRSATGGMVSSSSPAVSSLGARVLADGGTAVDAALAMTAMSWLALPGQCGIGGDFFAVVREPDGRVWTVNGSGFGPDGGDGRGLPRPRPDRRAAHRRRWRSPCPARSARCATLHRRGGTRALAELWAPGVGGRARRRAVHGQEPARHHRARRRRWRATRTSPRGCCPTGALPRGRRPAAASRLADSIELLARRPQALYRGELAERAVAAAAAPAARRSPATSGCSAATSPAEAAISAPYGDLHVHQTPPPSAGLDGAAAGRRCSTGCSTGLPTGGRRVRAPAGARRPPRLPGPVRALRRDNDAWRGSCSPTPSWPGPVASSLASRSPAGPRPGIGRRHHQLPRGGRATGAAVSRSSHSLAFTFGARISVPGTGVAAEQPAGPRRLPAARAPQRARARGASRCTRSTPGSPPTPRGRLRHVGQHPRRRRPGAVEHAAALRTWSTAASTRRRRSRRRGPPCIPGCDADALGDAGDAAVREPAGRRRARPGCAERGHDVRDVPGQYGGAGRIGAGHLGRPRARGPAGAARTRGWTGWRSVSEHRSDAAEPAPDARRCRHRRAPGRYVPGRRPRRAGRLHRRDDPARRRASCVHVGVVGRELDVGEAREAAGLCRRQRRSRPSSRRSGRWRASCGVLRMTVYIAAVDGFTAHTPRSPTAPRRPARAAGRARRRRPQRGRGGVAALAARRSRSS